LLKLELANGSTAVRDRLRAMGMLRKRYQR